MKKLLYTTTALVATTGMAAAEVSFSGYGRFGIRYQQQESDSDNNETYFEGRLRINVDVSVESDNGIKFGGRVRLQSDDNGTDGQQNAAAFNGAQFSAESGGLRINVGNTFGAIDAMPNYYGHEPGLTNFVGQYTGVNYGFTGYPSTGDSAQTLYARYAAGNFAIAASYTTNRITGDADASRDATIETARDAFEAFEVPAFTVADFEIPAFTGPDFGDAPAFMGPEFEETTLNLAALAIPDFTAAAFGDIPGFEAPTFTATEFTGPDFGDAPAF
ncbi:MAG: porin, partial [Rhodobacteraceae bacterium]|nr:porin [Paracoccaceae bacterium]